VPTPAEIEAQIAAVSTNGRGIDWSSFQPDKEAAMIAEAQRRTATVEAQKAEIASVVAVAPDAPAPSGVDEVPAPEVAPASEGAVPTYPERLRIRTRELLFSLIPRVPEGEARVELDRAILYLETADEFEHQR
jgi:hypothetical protein